MYNGVSICSDSNSGYNNTPNISSLEAMDSY